MREGEQETLGSERWHIWCEEADTPYVMVEGDWILQNSSYFKSEITQKGVVSFCRILH